MTEEMQDKSTVKHDMIEHQRKKMMMQKEQLRQHEAQWRVYNKIVFSLCILMGTLIAI